MIKENKHPTPPKVLDAYFLCSLNFTEGKSDFVSDCFCLDYTLGRLRNQASFLLLSGCEKSSNKCKTLLAKHHFIILHNSVCALLVNLHRLPLFSFCSLLILLYLCQSCQFFLEQFAGGFPSEHLPWVVVDPVLYPLDIVLCPVIEVFSLRYLPAYQSVLVLVAATLK